MHALHEKGLHLSIAHDIINKQYGTRNRARVNSQQGLMSSKNTAHSPCFVLQGECNYNEESRRRTEDGG